MVLSENQMIDLWLLRKGFEPLREDCRIERSDGADLRSLARTECRLWYENLLLSAPREALVVNDCSADAVLATTTSGSILLHLPADCVRVFDVKLRGWDAPARIVPADSPEARRQRNSYAAAGPARPVAVLNPDNTLELFSCTYSSDNSDTLQYLNCVCRPEHDEDAPPVYEFLEPALNLLPFTPL